MCCASLKGPSRRPVSGGMARGAPACSVKWHSPALKACLRAYHNVIQQCDERAATLMGR